MRDRSLRQLVLAKIFKYVYLCVSLHPSHNFILFQVADSAWVILREEGAIIEEADDDDANDGTEETFDEKDALAEKIGLHLQDISANFDEAGGEIRTKHADRLGYSESDSPRLM